MKNKKNRWSSFKNIAASFATLCAVALVVSFGMHFPGSLMPSAKADTFPVNCAIAATPTPTPIVDGTPLPPNNCTPTPTPYPTPTHPELEKLPQNFQNPNGAVMAWIQYGGVDEFHKKPGVIVIHPTNWNAGYAGQVAGEAEDLSEAGFFAAAVWYELAPNADIAASPAPVPGAGYIPGQPCHEDDNPDNIAGWRMIQQTNDIKNYINAMRADPRCNGWVGVVGGSAGASHAITVALDTNASGSDGEEWPNWMGENGDTRPNCAVMLSAIYDFADWTPTTGLLYPDAKFVHYGMNNYAQTLVRSELANLPLNPVNLVPAAASYGFKPIFMINSYYDNPTAYHQLVRMICVLEDNDLTLGTDYKYLTIPGTDHAFQYWNNSDELDPPHTVKRDVINYLKDQAGL